ncbi:hypothetical protein [Kitasatospora sp. NPDC050543]|uniref:hypothetical protein n=1 Tax=Kitasatospora sp. NPDC050543 TaxID=3364054 RepID=UPI0037ACAAA4
MRIRSLASAAALTACLGLGLLTAPAQAAAPTTAVSASAPAAPAASVTASHVVLYKWWNTGDGYGRKYDCDRRAAWWFDTHTDVYGAECRWNAGIRKWQVWIQR